MHALAAAVVPSGAAFLVASDVPAAVEGPAIAALIGLLWWFSRSADRTATSNSRRIDALEAEVSQLRHDNRNEHHLKHQALADAAALRNAVRGVRRLLVAQGEAAIPAVMSLLEEPL